MKNRQALLIVVLVLLAAGGIWWFFQTLGELEKPVLRMSQDISILGRQKAMAFDVADKKTGIRHVTVEISQNGQTYTLLSDSIPRKGMKVKRYNIIVDPVALKLKDGTATFSVKVTDYSLWKNLTHFNRNVMIDTVPLQISLLTPTNHVTVGGTGVVAFHVSKPTVEAGVMVNDHLFKAYPLMASNTPCYVTYFALPLDAGAGKTSIRITAKDITGNESAVGVPCLIKEKKFRSDKVNSSGFLQQKMPEFQAAFPELRGKNLTDTFTYVNVTMRNDNSATIRRMAEKTAPRQLWQDVFLRMEKASPMALFGDQRIYLYEDKPIGQSVHLGVDLASTTNAPIKAANSGIVIFSGPLGIYGNAVMIDHGMGLSTLYGHMNSIGVKVGQEVKRGDIIGQTGHTGLAGGDHLHFSVLVGGDYVNPQEWWDPHWIADNVTKKLAACGH